MQKLKSYSKRAVIGLLAMLFFSNVTFAHSLDFHLCQGELQSVAFFGEKSSCSKMMEIEMNAPRSCCDAQKDRSGLVFTQKSCCENVQVIQDDVLDKPGIDLNQTPSLSFDFIADFAGIDLKIDQITPVLDKVEIPPPPIIHHQHSQEKLQVFII